MVLNCLQTVQRAVVLLRKLESFSAARPNENSESNFLTKNSNLERELNATKMSSPSHRAMSCAMSCAQQYFLIEFEII